MVRKTNKKVVRRLRAAEGYLELDLPKLALEELTAIEDAGSLQIPALWLAGEALKADGRFEEAIAPLRHVAETVSGAMSEQAWESLTECLEKSGRHTAIAAPDEPPQPEETPPIPAGARRVSVQIPGFGTLKFAAQHGAVKISVEPQRPVDPHKR